MSEYEWRNRTTRSDHPRWELHRSDSDKAWVYDLRAMVEHASKPDCWGVYVWNRSGPLTYTRTDFTGTVEAAKTFARTLLALEGIS